MRVRFLFCVLCAVVAAALAFALITLTPRTITAQPPRPAAGKPVSFINDVAPILKESCFGCHGAKNPKGKLDMTTFAKLRKGGSKDDPIVVGKPEDSYLVEVLKATNKKRMPPLDSGDALPKDKIAIIERWVKEGAKLDTGLTKESDLLKELRKRWVPPALLTTYQFPTTITAMTFSPDGKKLIVGGHHELMVYEPSTGKLEKRIRTRARRALAMLWLSDGKLVVAGGRPGEEGDVCVYNINGGTAKTENGVAILDGVTDKGVLIKQLLEADDEVLCLALSKDGKQLASGGCDRLVNIWDISGGIDKAKAAQSIENHADWVFGVSFSPDGKQLFTASRDKTAKVWDIKARESVVTFPAHQNSVYGVLPSADGKNGYSVGEDNQLRVWQASGPKAGAAVRNVGAHGKVVLKLVEVPKKTQLVTCSADQTVKVWNLPNLQNARTLSGFKDQVFAVAVSPDGSMVAGGSFAGEVRVWNMADGKLVKDFNASPGYVEKKEKK